MADPATFAAVAAASGATAGTAATTAGFFATIKASLTVASIKTFAVRVAIAAVGSFLITKLFGPKAPSSFSGGSSSRSTIREEVFPRRWVVGRARVAPAMFYYQEDRVTRYVSGGGRVVNKGRVHVGMYLSTGACESIEGIWISQEYVPLERETIDGEVRLQPPQGNRFRGRIWIWEYLSADGTQGAALREASRNARDFSGDQTQVPHEVWTADHRVEGHSWAYVRMWQPNYGRHQDNRFWDSFPAITFDLKGIKMSLPDQTTPIWSDNAADVRYWFDTVRRDIPPSTIDLDDYRAARTLSGQQVTVDLPDSLGDYIETTKRYSVNGIIQADQSADQVIDQLDSAWQGYGVESGGKHFYRPGADRPSSFTINEDDIAEVGRIIVAAPLQNKINAVTATLAQSRDHAYTQYAVPEVVDQPAVDRDNTTLPSDLGTLAFTNTVVQANRIMATTLRRARDTAQYQYVLRPRDDNSHYGLIPTDRVTVNDSVNGLNGRLMEIRSIQVRPDFHWTLDLLPVTPGTYSDSIQLPPIKEQVFDFSESNREVPVPANVTLNTRVDAQQGGSYLINLLVDWTDAVLLTTVRYRVEGETDWRFVDGADSDLEIAGVVAGKTYEVQVRHTDRLGYNSDWTDTVTHTIEGDLTPPSPITGLTTEQTPPIAGGYKLSWTAPTDEDLDHFVIEEAISDTTGFIPFETRETSFSRTGIGTAGDYAVTVYAVDAAGNRSTGVSGTVSVTTATATRTTPATFYADVTPASTWSDVAANGATDGDNIIGDGVILYNENAMFREYRAWNGSAWVNMATDGTFYTPGQIIAGQIASDAIQTRHLTADSITADQIAANAISAERVIAPGLINEYLDRDLALQYGASRTFRVAMLHPTRIIKYDYEIGFTNGRGVYANGQTTIHRSTATDLEVTIYLGTQVLARHTSSALSTRTVTSGVPGVSETTRIASGSNRWSEDGIWQIDEDNDSTDFHIEWRIGSASTIGGLYQAGAFMDRSVFEFSHAGFRIV